jgi:hypothetical protein
MVRGIFYASQLARQVGKPVQIGLVAHTFRGHQSRTKRLGYTRDR